MGGSSDVDAAGGGVVRGGLAERLAGGGQQGAAFVMLRTLGQRRLQVRRGVRLRQRGQSRGPLLQRGRRGGRVHEGAGAVVGRVHHAMRRGRQMAKGPCQVRGAVVLQVR